MASSSSSETAEIYFEKQTRFLCGAHALNNLFGKAEFSIGELDSLAKTAGTHSVFGYYDVNTLQLAVDSRGYELVWFDSRKDVTELPLDDNTVVGFLINTTAPLLVFFKSRHWKCIRRLVSDTNSLDVSYYFMDSKYKKPQLMTIEETLRLVSSEKDSGSQILVLRSKPSIETNSAQEEPLNTTATPLEKV
jgi:josephin